MSHQMTGAKVCALLQSLKNKLTTSFASHRVFTGSFEYPFSSENLVLRQLNMLCLFKSGMAVMNECTFSSQKKVLRVRWSITTMFWTSIFPSIFSSYSLSKAAMSLSKDAGEVSSTLGAGEAWEMKGIDRGYANIYVNVEDCDLAQSSTSPTDEEIQMTKPGQRLIVYSLCLGLHLSSLCNSPLSWQLAHSWPTHTSLWLPHGSLKVKIQFWILEHYIVIAIVIWESVLASQKFSQLVSRIDHQP